MPVIFANHIEAMEEAIAAFTDKPYAMLMAQMQSGKTTTYRLIACEMLRLGKVDHVIIFSGTNDTDLRDQTDPKNEPPEVIDTFNTEYEKYLISTGKMTRDQSFATVFGLIRRIKVCWAQDLDKHTRPGRTLYIWEESHYAQSQTQQVDMFNARIGIDATGNAPKDCYVLSVSATGFSELAANHNFNQNKSVVKLKPGEGYVSVEMQRPRIRAYNISKLVSILAKYKAPCYGVIRARDKEADEIKFIAKDWTIIEHDMKNKKDLNAILRTPPAVKTLILIKGMLRMGKVLIKTHIGFVIETGSKTDTILQGLLGRCCGYYKGSIDVYIKHLNWKELNAFIDLYNGFAESIPCKAMNVRKREGDRVPTIPLKITLGEDRVQKTRLWEDICDVHAATADAIQFHERDDDAFWNGNPENYVREIRRIIKTKCFEAHHGRREHFVVHGTQKAIDPKTLKNIKDAYKSKTPRCNFASAGAGACATADEIVVWYSPTALYISMQIKMGIKVPETTLKEVFCKSPEPYVNGGFKMDVGGNTRFSARQLESELVKFIQLSRQHVTDKKITKNGSFKCIQLTPGVFKELPAIQQRLRTNGAELSWKKRSWSKADCADVCLSEISWTLSSEAISEAREITIAEPIHFPVIDLNDSTPLALVWSEDDDDDTPLGMLVKNGTR
jgi:hypothetical protein